MLALIIIPSAVLLILLFVILINKSENKNTTRDKKGKNEDEHPDYDNVVRRNRLGRVIVSTICGLIALGGPPYFLIWIMGKINMEDIALFGGLILGIELLLMLMPRITVNAPAVQGVVSQDNLTDKLVVYGGGFHARYPWESVHRQDHISLEDVTREEKESIASLGPKLTIKIQYRWKPDLKHLDRFKTRGESTINSQFTGMFFQFLSARIAFLHAEDVRQGMEYLAWVARLIFDLTDDPFSMSNDMGEIIKRINKTLSPDILEKIEKVMSGEQQDEQNESNEKKEKESAEEELGINMLSFNIIDVDFPKKVQEARDADEENLKITKAAMRHLGINPDANEDNAYQKALDKFFEIDPKERHRALRLAAIIAGQGGISEKALVIEGDPKNLLGPLAAELLDKELDDDGKKRKGGK